LLRELGLELVHAPPAPDDPDGVFVEDAVVVVDRLAILTRPGAASRRDEPASLRAVLADRGLSVAEIAAPGTLDGGDVLQVGDTIFVGRTTRTDDVAIGQLGELVAPLGRRVLPVAVEDALHLKTAATALPDGRLVVRPGAVEPDTFAGREVLAAEEPSGANVLVVGTVVVVAASAPRTAARLRAEGQDVRTVDLGELEKLEAGPTCPSVLLPPRHPAHPVERS
jgi:dimethylargininase